MNLNQLTGADLMAARTHIGLSISAVAKLTGINRNTLSQFEQEKASLSGSERNDLQVVTKSAVITSMNLRPPTKPC